MNYIKKRNGDLVPFDSNKIKNAISKAFFSCQKEINDEELDAIVSKINVYDGKEVEKIQDDIEDYLIDGGYKKEAKAFMKYRGERAEDRDVQERIDYMEAYCNTQENAATASETDSNANVTIKNVANLEGEVYKTRNRRIQRKKMKDKLNEMFPEVAKQYEVDINNHIIYPHDEAASPTQKVYCIAVSTYPLLMEGTGNIDGITPSEPNDIQSFCGQVTNLVFLLSSQCRGAVALGDFFVSLNFNVIKDFGNDWYKKLDCIVTSQHCVKQRTVKDMIRKGMKQFIYGVNQPAGNRSYNSPFSNLQYADSQYFNALFKDYYYPDGTQPEWEAIDALQRIFMELHRELRLIKPLTFPVTTMALLHNGNDVIDKDYKQLCCDEWAKGGSFFCYLSDNPEVLSSCCRVLSEVRENTFNSTIGLCGIMTGSANVITLNLNRILQDWVREADYHVMETPDIYDEESKFSLRKYLTEILERVYKYQIAYKTLTYEMEEKGMYSCCNANYIRVSKLYCTIGIIGYCEAAEYLGLTVNNNEEYTKFLSYIFNIIKEENRKHSIYDSKKPFIFNCEAIPGESLAGKLYRWDKRAGYKVPKDQNLYSSYFFKQWDPEISVLDKLKLHGGEVAKACSGGQACHINLDAHLDSEQYSKIIDVCIVSGTNYFTFNIPFTECKDCGHIVAAPVEKCPICDSRHLDYWTRIIGYLRPVSNFGKDRQIEQKKRIYSNFNIMLIRGNELWVEQEYEYNDKEKINKRKKRLI